MTSPPSVTEISLQSTPSDQTATTSTPTTKTGTPGSSHLLIFEPLYDLCFMCLLFLLETCATSRPSSDTNIVLVVATGVFRLFLLTDCTETLSDA